MPGTPAVMKARFYNEHAETQANALQNVLPLLERAAKHVAIPANGLLQVAEFGCSQGVNSITPVKALAAVLDKRVEQHKPLQLMITHEDLPSNDFSSLFQLLSNPETSYICQPYKNLSLRYSAIGRSFYEPLLPAGSVHLGFSCSALQWLSKAPLLLSQTPHWYSSLVTAEERAAGARQAADDLATFLQLRADEFVPGGLLVLSFIASGGDSDVDTHAYLGDKVEACWLQMLAEGAISQQEISALSSVPGYHRSMASSLAAIPAGQWEVLHASVASIEHPAYDQYKAGQIDAKQCGQAHSNMWRAICEDMQVGQLEPFRGREGAQAVVGEYYKRLTDAFAADPQRLLASTNNLLLQRK